MKKYSFLILSLAFFASFTTDQFKYRTIKHDSFLKGEKLKYSASYGMFNAADATVELFKDVYHLNQRPCYRVDIQAKSKGVFGMTMHIDDLWRSYIDTVAMIPHKFYRNIEEGKYRKKESVWFEHAKKVAHVTWSTNGKPEKNQDYAVPDNVQDIVSGYYFLRTIAFENLKKDQIITIPGFVEDSCYSLKVKYVGKEVLKTKFGKVNAHVLSPIMPENSLFDGKNSIQFWVSDDKNRIPLRIKAKMFIGAVEVVLVEHEGLRYALNTTK